MLTVKQPTSYGYRSVHDLPTPPSTSRPSPPLSHSEAVYKHYQTASRSHSPSNQAMSAPHRGLPPPAAMALPPQQAPPAGVQPPQHHGHQQPPHPPPPAGQGGPQGQSWTSLPPPPQLWHGSEESMKNWLQARAEEEKTKQEEERTRQEGLRLEQRRVEMDMLRDSLRGGIPPPMIPLVFAGMAAGGTLPQAALDWAQQFLMPSQGQQLQLLPAQRQHSPDPHQREGATQSQYPGASANPAPQPAPAGYGPYPGSPTRPRGQTVSGVIGRPSMSNIGGIQSQPGQPGAAGVSPYGSHAHMHTQPAPQESSPGLYFHHWQPPATQAGSGSSNRPGSPSGESSKKRKAPGPQPTGILGEQRLRSPPPFIQSSFSNPPSGRKGGHKRQRSDVPWYRPSSHHHHSHHVEDPERGPRSASPTRDVIPEFSRERYAADPNKHSVSTLLSHEPSRVQFNPIHESERLMARHREEEGQPRDRTPPRTSEQG